jgi:arsenate reductase (thioredoxin)
MNEELNLKIEAALSLEISAERKEILQVLIDYIKSKRKAEAPIRLHFICTHNSRRSQFSQIWAQTAADYFQIPAQCYSGGVEVTACNEIQFTLPITPKTQTPSLFSLNYSTTP